MKTRNILSVSFAVTATAATLAFSPLPEKVLMLPDAGVEAPSEPFGGTRALPRFNSGSDALKADFSVAGADALAPVYSEKFDSGKGGWTFDDTNEVVWTVKRIAAPENPKSFSAIDSEDVSSLFVEGPYQVYKREKSSATSPEIPVPANAALSFYAGFSLNYDDECRLSLDAIAGTDTIPLWNSKDAPGDRPWQWRRIDLKLESLTGRNVKFRFTYGPGGKDSFGTGGYLGDFAIDNFSLSGLQPVESISVATGEAVELTDISVGEPTEWSWSMPGAVPETSAERNPRIYYKKDGTFDVSLTVKDAAGNVSTKTRTAFVNVTGTAPQAEITPPATFRLSSTRKHLVAPLVPVTFSDGSSGFPDSWKWTFTGTDPDHEKLTESSEETPQVAYSFLHDQHVTLEAANRHGSSSAQCDVSVEYSGVINNMRPDDKATNFDMEDWGVFPGSNTRKITAFAERFSKPSRPVKVDGAYVYFTRAEATEVADQIANVGVHLYTSKDGRPDRRLDSWWWSVFELDLPSAAGGNLVGTAFQFTESPVVDDEFFIVVDGLPEYSEGCCVAFGMAGFRAEGNTALMLKEGEWIEASDYFPAGQNHTSFMIYPSVRHSVMSPLPAGKPAELTVGGSAGTSDFEIFSIMGYETPVKSDAEWLRVDGKPNGLTVDTLKIAYDAIPAGLEERTGHLTLTDGATELAITVVQKSGSAVCETIIGDTGLSATTSPFTDELRLSGLTAGQEVRIYSLDGTLMATAVATDPTMTFSTGDWPAGIYAAVAGKTAIKVIRR